MRARTVLAASAASVLALVLPAAGPATASPADDPIVSGLAGPLQFDVSTNGSIYVAQAFAGVITRVRPNGTTRNVVTEEGVSGVATKRSQIVYTVNIDPSEGETTPSVELLKRRFPNGKIRILANLGRFERRNNPDQGQRYGLRRLHGSCKQELQEAGLPPEVLAALLPYTGQVDSNPYAVANAPEGGWYVADAGANAILHVSPKKRVTVMHVARPQKVTVTAEFAESFGLPDCVVGLPLAFEPVPTDVEVNRLGYLIFSLLPGGPEDDTLGGRGAVYRLSPGDFEWTRLADGFVGATNVATARGGRIYVAELFGNRVSLIRKGVVTTVSDEVLNPAAVEFANGTLYASINAFTDGQIVTLP